MAPDKPDYHVGNAAAIATAVRVELSRGEMRRCNWCHSRNGGTVDFLWWARTFGKSKLRLRQMHDDQFLDVRLLEGARRDGPLVLPWPVPGNPGGMLLFSTAHEWRSFILSLGLSSGIPEIVAAKFRRAQMLYFLAWVYFDLIKAGELVALTTLELALHDRYGNLVKKRGGGAPFAELLKYMLSDGLSDAKIPMVQRTGGSVTGFLSGATRPSLAEIRNKQAHGDPFDGFPCGGLLELVRDLIAFAYRNMVVSV
jgi:hypothetical protein